MTTIIPSSSPTTVKSKPVSKDFLKKITIHQTQNFDYYHIKTLNQMKVLADGTNWELQYKNRFFDFLQKTDLDIYIAVSRNSWFDKKNKIREKYMFTFPSLMGDRDTLYITNKLLKNIKTCKNKLQKNKKDIITYIRKSFEQAYDEYEPHRDIIFDNAEDAKELYDLYKDVPPSLDAFLYDRKRLAYSEKSFYLNNPENKKLIRSLKKSFEYVLANYNNDNWYNSLLKNYDKFFKNLTKKSKLKVLGMIEKDYYLSSYYGFDTSYYSIETVYDNYHPHDEVIFAEYKNLMESEFTNNDQTIKIKNYFKKGLPEPYHSIFQEFPLYKIYLILGRKIEKVVSIPLSKDANFIFETIWEESRKRLVRELEDLRNRIDIVREMVYVISRWC